VRDVEAKGRLFARGIPVTPESFSPDGYHFAYLHLVPGGFLWRKPVRCAFLLDLGTGGSRAIPAPKGRAARLAGWGSTGRFLLLETQQPDLLFALTGASTTYHWIYDVVTSEFVPRKPFTGRRDDRRFRWQHRGTYHGEWHVRDGELEVWPMIEGELAEILQRRGEALERADRERAAAAEGLAVGTGDVPDRRLGDVLERLDTRWPHRGQRDPVVSELFGDRPVLFARHGDAWIPVWEETEYVSVLDPDLAILTGPGGSQAVLHRGRWEELPLPPPPAGWGEVLETRWDRTGGFWDEADPLPRDQQYRRGWDPGTGVATYFHYATPDRRHLLTLYWFDAQRRVLRIVDLPKAWRR
jgi:hypothetical protein